MRKRRFSMAGLITLMAVALTAGPALATSDNVSGHLHHDATITQFTTWRLHTGGHINAWLNNGPNANGNMRMGLRGQDGAQFSSSQEWGNYPSTHEFTDWSGKNTFTQRWFAINAKMVNACGIFCDDDFGGTINFSLP